MSAAQPSVLAPARRPIAALVFCTIAIVVLLDQVTKYFAVLHLTEVGVEVIPGLFNLSLAYNKGAAFGILAGAPDGIRQLTLTATTVLALSAVLYLLWRHYYHSLPGVVSLGLILGGAIGNIIDRIRLGMVVDFLDFYWREHHWPAFNVADSAICVGVFVLLFLKPASSAKAEPVR